VKINPLSALPSEFDAFLFAPINEDGAGHPLNVLSVLARSDFDPWQEAAKLAQMSKAMAISTLTPLIAAHSARRDSDPVAEVISARLVLLLPSRASAKSPAPQLIADAQKMTRTDAVICIVAGVCILGIALGSELMAPQKTDLTPATPFQSQPIDRSAPSETGPKSPASGQ
jgi:hypothetical protein